MAKFGNRVKETSETTGTGTLDLAGAPTGFRSFAEEFTSGDTLISYLIVDDPANPVDYEYGKGTFTTGAPNTLARNTVEGSSNADASVPFTGTKTVIATPTAADFLAVLGPGTWGQKSATFRAITASSAQVAADDGKVIAADASALSPDTLNYTMLPEATAGDGFSVTINNVGATGSVLIKDDSSPIVTLRTLTPGESVSYRCNGTIWYEVAEISTPGVLAITGAYTVVATDDNKLITADGSGNSPLGVTATLLPVATAGDGFELSFKNIGATGQFTIDGDGAETIDGATTLVLSAEDDSATIRCDGVAWHVIDKTEAKFFTNVLTGLQMSNGTDTAHDIDITAGSCRSAADDANITLSAITKQIDATWAAGSAAGGLSSSLAASPVGPAVSSWYHVHAIVVANVADVGFDTSVIAANLVADHAATSYRRIGSVLTDGSANIIAFVQHGDSFWWDAAQADVAALTSSYATYTLSVPPDVRVHAMITAGDNGTDNSSFVNLRITGTTGPQGKLTVAQGVADAVAITGPATILTNTSKQIDAQRSTVSTTSTISTNGWIDARGKDS